jgi:PAS domain S-box-containing protein
MHNLIAHKRHSPGSVQRSSAVVYSSDLSGNFTFLNHEGELLSGYSREEACAMNIADIIDSESAGEIQQQILRDAEQRVGTVYEVDVIAKDGRCIPLEVSTRVVLRDGARIEVQGIAVPSVIRSQSPLSFQLRCVDQDFCYGIIPAS